MGPVDPLLSRVVADEWRLERRLGPSGAGTRYEAQSTRDGSYRVVEVLLGGHVPSERDLERYRRAFAAANELRHPNVAEVHTIGRLDGGAVYAVLDYFEGEDLATRIERDGALRWADARRICDDVAAGLSAAHAKGIVHDHLEPASIFVMRRLAAPVRALILHFGVSELARTREHDMMRDTGAYPRQSAYESPEKVSGEATDARSDVYALAAILFEMMTGSPPFTGPNVPAVLARVLSEPPPSVTACAKQPIPVGLEEILRKALAKDPDERPATVELLMRKVRSTEALQRWAWPSGADISAPVRRAAGNEPERAAEPPAAAVAVAPDARPRGVWIIAGALAIAFLLIGAALLMAMSDG